MSVFRPLDFFFFKMPHVSYLVKNLKILKDSMGGDPLPNFGHKKVTKKGEMIPSH